MRALLQGRVVGSQVSSILIAQLLRHHFHHGVFALAALVVGDRAGELRLVQAGNGGIGAAALAVGTVTGRALGGLGFPGSRIAIGVSQAGNGKFIPAGPQIRRTSSLKKRIRPNVPSTWSR